MRLAEEISARFARKDKEVSSCFGIQEIFKLTTTKRIVYEAGMHGSQ